MLRAKHYVRMPDKLYAPGDILPAQPPKEEEWLISVGAAERIPDENQEDVEQAEPKRKKRR